MTAPAPPLHARLAEYVEYARSTRRELVSFVAGLPESVLVQRPAPDRWSVTEILEHLSIIEDGVGRLVSNIIKQIRSEGAPVDRETSSILGCLDQYDIPNAPHKLTAPERVRPTGAVSANEAMQKLQDARARLLQSVQAANGLDLGQGTAPHLFFGPLTGYQWLVLICQHELRHVNQMKEAVRQLPA